MDLLFHDGPDSADMHYDYYVSPEEREEELERFRCSLGGKVCPSYLLKWADDYDLLPLGVLEEEQAAYLVPFYSLLNEINRLMLNDNKRQFAAFLIPNHELVQKYPPEALLQLLCIHDAVSCVAALLESRLDVDINYMDEKVVYLIGKAPLHIAAHNLCFRMTKLLLERGADADILADGCKTPLHMAVVACMSQIRIKGWTAEKSILGLFYILPELKEALDTVRLLASYSNEVEDLCIKYMSNGNVVSCVILLMAAWDKLMVPSAEGGLETTPVGQHLTRVLSNASLQQEICDRSFNTLSKENLVKNVTATLCVVENMWMTIAVLERYCHSKVQSVPIYELPIHITCELVKEAGLDLKPSVANIYSLLKLTPEAQVMPEQKHYVKPRRSHPILRSFLGKPVTSTFGSPSSPSMSHYLPYRTFHTLNFMENHLRKTPQVKPSSYNVLALAKVCAALVRFGKRSIK